MQKEEERQNRVLKEIIDNVKKLPVESQNLLFIPTRGMALMRNYMMRQNVADQPRMPSDKYSV